MRQQDISHFSEHELSLLVFNDESLYQLRRCSDFIELLEELFVFTADQLETLKQDLHDDENENET